MSSLRRTIFVLMVPVAFVCLSLRAQPAPGDAPTTAPKSPVTLFRELLAMTPEQRKAAISIRPPDIQKRILQKLNEYQILPGELRELRLQETELRWYLRPLMDVPRTNRATLLARIPENERALVEERLKSWDLLPPPLQDQFKDNDLIASYFAQIGSATPEQREAILHEISADRREELEKGLDRWQQMTEDQRQKTLAGFNHIFELTPEEKEKTLDSVSDDERREMEKTLSTYAHLTLAQRAQCIKSFEKFAGMSISERQQFLKNAKLWREMTPEERQKWREVVNVAPILPPTAFPHSSPHSPGFTLMKSATPVATN